MERAGHYASLAARRQYGHCTARAQQPVSHARWSHLSGEGRRDIPTLRIVRTLFRENTAEAGSITTVKNATVEYHWLEGQYDDLPALMADVDTPPGVARDRHGRKRRPRLRQTAATAIGPIVFRAGDDPVRRLVLVASLGAARRQR